MHTILIRALCTLAFALAATPDGNAAGYPVSGKWTYNDVNGDGPSKECGSKYMEFSGEQRIDKGGGVPRYRNLSVTPSGSNFQIVDQFATGQINARSVYMLRKLDADHIELNMQAGGKTIKLRRCE